MYAHKESPICHFLKNKKKTSNPSEKNVIDFSEKKGSYFIDDFYEEFFEVYNLSIDFHPLIAENQRSKKFSGFYVDLDYHNYILDKHEYVELIKIIFNYIRYNVNMTNLSTLVFVTEPSKYQEDKTGCHIIFPNLHITRGAKKTILHEMLKMDFFNGRCPDERLEDIIDQNLWRNQTMLYGSRKGIESYHHNLAHVFNLKFSKSRCMVEEHEKDFDNIALEMSILYTGEHSSIILTSDSDDLFRMEEDIKDIDELEVLLNDDPRAKFVLNLVDLLDTETRLGRYDNWVTFIRMMANINIHYKPIMFYGSGKHNKVDDPKTKEIIKAQWKIGLRSQGTWGLPTLITWAKQDSPEEYEVVFKDSISYQAYRDALRTFGKMDDDILSDLVKMSYAGTLVYDGTYWWKMITKGSHAYKWKRGSKKIIPIGFNKKLKSTCVPILIEILKSFKYKLEQSGQKEQKKALEDIIKNIRNLITQVGNSARCSTVGKFLINDEDIHIIDFKDEVLDQNPFIIGVNGGILILPSKKGEDVKFMEYNNYFVSLNTKRTYDPNNKKIPILLEVLRDAFVNEFGEPDEETFRAVMFHFCRALTRQQKETFMLSLYGVGGNAKSLLNALLTGAFGVDYHQSISATYLCENRTSGLTADPVLMDMKAKNFIAFTEYEEGAILNEGKLKYLLSPGEYKTARRLNENTQQFLTHFVLFMLSNYVPRITSNLDCIWRRVMFCKLHRRYLPETHKDYDMNNPLIKLADPKIIEEWPLDPEILDAFFTILVDFYVEYINKYDGDYNNIPINNLRKQTDSFRESQNYLHKFVAINMKKVEGEKVYVEYVVEQFQEWVQKEWPNYPVFAEKIRKDINDYFPEIVDGEILNFMFKKRHD